MGPRRRADPGDLSEGVCVAPPNRSAASPAGACDALEFVTEGSGFVGRQLDDQSTSTFKWYPHHDAAPLLRCFKRTVSGPGLHRRHRVLLQVRAGPPARTWSAPSTPGQRTSSHARPRTDLSPLHCSLSRSPLVQRPTTVCSAGGRGHPATPDMVVDHAGCLHQRVGGGRTDEAEPAPLEFTGHGLRFVSGRGNFGCVGRA